MQLFTAIFFKYCAKCKSVITKDTTKLFPLVLFSLTAWKRAVWRISCVSMLSVTKQLVCKLEVLQPQPTVLSLLEILSLDWNFWPILGIFGEVWKCVKWTISVYFANHIWSIFDIYHWHSDFMLHHHRFRDFWSCICESLARQVRQCPNSIRGGIAEYLDFWPSPRKRK